MVNIHILVFLFLLFYMSHRLTKSTILIMLEIEKGVNINILFFGKTGVF